MLLRHFTQDGDNWQVSERIRAMVELRPHNLLEPSARISASSTSSSAATC